MGAKKKVKKEVIVKTDPDGESALKEEKVVAEIDEIKAEDVEVPVGDIEDIGQASRQRSSRDRS